MCYYSIFFIIIREAVIVSCKPVKICITVMHSVGKINGSVMTVRIGTKLSQIVGYFIFIGFTVKAFYICNTASAVVTDEISYRAGVLFDSLFIRQILFIKFLIGGVEALYLI